MNPNKFKGHCAHCQSTVPARAGVVVRIGRDWRVYCQAHKAQAQAAQPAEHVPDRFDMMVEDQMRDACGC